MRTETRAWPPPAPTTSVTVRARLDHHDPHLLAQPVAHHRTAGLHGDGELRGAGGAAHGRGRVPPGRRRVRDEPALRARRSVRGGHRRRHADRERKHAHHHGPVPGRRQSPAQRLGAPAAGRPSGDLLRRERQRASVPDDARGVQRRRTDRGQPRQRRPLARRRLRSAAGLPHAGQRLAVQRGARPQRSGHRGRPPGPGHRSRPPASPTATGRSTPSRSPCRRPA